MRTVVHLSDLHFGNNDPALFGPLRDAVEHAEPTVVVISGDLVEHATSEEFYAAKAFLNTLPGPQIIVPGNHDLPFWDPVRRVVQGLTKYRRIISDITDPHYHDEEIAVVGADSAHLFPMKGGRITLLQLEKLHREFSVMPDCLIKMLVTHHPFDLPDPLRPHMLIGHSLRAVRRLAPVVDVLMAGHIHLSSSGSTSSRYKTGEHAMLFVQAGTAISHRNKGEANSFNVLRTGRSADRNKQVVVDHYSWLPNESRFACRQSSGYLLGKEGWAQAPPTVIALEPHSPKSGHG